MRHNIAKVIQAFKEGRACQGDSKNTCSTDGSTIFSYRMPIAYWNESGIAEVVPYESGPSRTTKSQIRASHYELCMRWNGDAWVPKTTKRYHF
jgi:hypothetical protein